MRRVLAPLLALTFLARADASVAVRASVEDLVDLCSVAVDGTVVDHATTLDRAAGAIWTTYSVRIGAVFVGDAVAEVLVRVRGGRVGAVEQETIGAPKIEDGERLVAFLGPDDRGAREVIGMAQGVFRVETDPKTGAVYCGNSTAGLSLVESDGARTTAEPLRFSLAELASRVNAERAAITARRRAAGDALERRFAEWTRAAIRHQEMSRGRPGGAP